MVKKFICVGEKYKNLKTDEESIHFFRIGEIFLGKNGKEYAKLYTNPTQLLHIFEDKPKESKEDF